MSAHGCTSCVVCGRCTICGCDHAKALWTFATPVVVEDVDDTGTHWYLSFDGPNPAEDQGVRCVDRTEALKLKSLIETIGAVDNIAVFDRASPS